MKLVTGESLRITLGLGALQAFIDLADSAAERAAAILINDLRTPLARASYSDLFLVDKINLTDYRLDLKLTAGFLSGDVLIGTGLTSTVAVADTSISDYFATPQINTERGVVTLTDSVVAKYISVRYTAGYADDGTVFTGTPEWMVEAATAKAIALMAASREFKSKDGPTLDPAPYVAQYAALIHPHIRYTPGCRYPLG